MIPAEFKDQAELMVASDLVGIAKQRALHDPIFFKAYKQVYARLLYLRTQSNMSLRDDQLLMYIAADNIVDHVRSTT